MEWRDQGTLLTTRRHGESSAIIEVFTENHGRHAGIVRGGASRKLAAVLQPGTQLDVEWRARLEEHLGTFRIEPLQSRAAGLLNDRLSLATLNAVCGLLKFALPEREPHPRLYEATQNLLTLLTGQEGWQEGYLFWELLLLEDLGFGLSLRACAVTGRQDGLEFVSPRTGHAVTREGAGEWVEQLLAYPDPKDLSASLRTTGYFLEHWLAKAIGEKELPKSRERLLNLLERDGIKGAR